MNPPPLPPGPFGDPTQVQRANNAAVGKGVGCGCGSCALLLAVIAAFVVGIFALVMGGMRNSDVCTQALAKARASVEVRALLGTPIEQGWILSGGIRLYNDSGSAYVSFPISGPKGGATVNAEARKRNGTWIFSRLLVIPDSTGKPIDLLAKLQVT